VQKTNGPKYSEQLEILYNEAVELKKNLIRQSLKIQMNKNLQFGLGNMFGAWSLAAQGDMMFGIPL